jgi:hypothetical protein
LVTLVNAVAVVASFTVTVAEALFVQVAGPSVTKTVYVVVAVGETVIDAVVCPSGLQR